MSWGNRHFGEQCRTPGDVQEHRRYQRRGVGDDVQANIHAMFYLVKAAVPHMKPGSAIVNTASVNSDMPNPILLAYATTKGAIQNFTGGLASSWQKRASG